MCVYEHTTGKFYHYEFEKLYGIKHMRVYYVSEYPYPQAINVHESPKQRYKKENRMSFGQLMTDIMDMLDSWDSIHEGDIPPTIIYSVHEKPSYCTTEGRILFQYFFDQYPKRIYEPHFLDLRHHFGHMCGGYYQSPYDNAFILSIDGGSHEGCTWTGFASKDKGVTRLENIEKIKLGKVYNLVAHCLNIIPSNGLEQLDWAGKLMGLSAYGKYNKDLYNIIERYALNTTPDTLYEMYGNLKKHFGYKEGTSQIKDIMEDRVRQDRYSGFPWDDRKRGIQYYIRVQSGVSEEWFIKNIEHQMDVAYNVQKVTEDIVVNLIKKYQPIIKQNDNNLIITGGVALNVLVNQTIKEKFPDINVFVPPNPNDMGLSYGSLRQYMQLRYKYTKKTPNMQYDGPAIRDTDECFKRPSQYAISLDEVAKLLKQGKIIGLVQDGAELGPRALGNRSILCDAMNPNMKDIINQKVKMREWYRPFAPVCKLEDAPKYFDSVNFDNMEYMSFAVKTKPEYRHKLQSITHEDGTARLQTVTKEQNPTLYSLLDKVDGVLLNTSFNIRGKPILNSLKDAFWVLDNTELDHVIVKLYGQLWLF